MFTGGGILPGDFCPLEVAGLALERSLEIGRKEGTRKGERERRDEEGREGEKG